MRNKIVTRILSLMLCAVMASTMVSDIGVLAVDTGNAVVQTQEPIEGGIKINTDEGEEIEVEPEVEGIEVEPEAEPEVEPEIEEPEAEESAEEEPEEEPEATELDAADPVIPETEEIYPNELPVLPPSISDEGISPQTETGEEVAGRVTSINSLSVQFVSGATKNDNGDWVWTPQSDASGHRFVFRVNYSTSGDGTMDPAVVEKDADGNVTGVTGGIQIAIPKSVVKNRDGEADDTYEMSIPSLEDRDSMTESELKENKWAYVVVGDQIIVYNCLAVDAAQNGYLEVAYATNSKTYEYKDYGADNDESNPFQANIKASDQDKTSDELKAHINTTATLSSTDKRYPEQSSWNENWGEAPDDADDYYWQYWTVASTISNVTQRYDYTILDTVTSVETPTGQPLDCELYAYKISGHDILLAEHITDEEQETEDGLVYSSKGITVKDQSLDDTRYDIVITRVKKSDLQAAEGYDEDLTSYTIRNKVVATVSPNDEVDDDTTKESTREFGWTLPTFVHPNGHFWMEKHADENWYHTWNYRWHDSRPYSSYDLDKFQESKVDKVENLGYGVWFYGYAYPWTIADDDVSGDYKAYGKKAVTYEVTDSQFYPLTIDGKDSDGTYRFQGTTEPKEEDLEAMTPLAADDYDIAYIDYDLFYEDAQKDENGDPVLDENTQNFIIKRKAFTEDDILYIYTKTGDDDYVLAGSYNLGSKVLNKADGSKIDTMTDSRITFTKDEDGKTYVDGYKITNTNAYYHSNYCVYPYVTIYDTETIKNWTGTGKLGAEGSTAKDVVLLKNIATGRVYQIEDNEENELFTRDAMSGDRLKASQKDSSIRKKVVSTSNNTKKKAYTITWRVNAHETYTEGEGETHFLQQESGTIYDLLPSGSALQDGSVQVEIPTGSDPDPTSWIQYGGSSRILDENEYSIQTIDNYNGSGRTLLIVKINTAGLCYNVYYTTVHPWSSLADYGKNAKNPVAYETGNDEITGGFPDNPKEENNSGETIQESDSDLSDENQDLFQGLDKDSQPGDYKFIYDEESHNISALTSAASGLNKRVMAASDSNWNYDTTVTTDETYRYRLRYQNTYTASAKNLILFDTIENFYTSDDCEIDKSQWYGALTGVDTTQLSKAVNGSGSGATLAPVVYYSTVTGLDLDVEENHRITNTAVWSSSAPADLSQVTAVAIDMRYDTQGQEFILAPGSSLTAVLYMQAPHTEPTTEKPNQYPETYNNVYLQDSIQDVAALGDWTEFYIHHNYTTVRYAVTADIGVHKVSERNQDQAISGIVFRLFGTSYYGTTVDLKQTTDRNGNITFKDVEKGEYILQEYSGTADWIEDYTEHKVVINGDRTVTIDGKDYTEGEDGTLQYLTVTNKPRVHAEIEFNKVDALFKTTMVAGAQYTLYGTSDYGTDIYMTATSTFDDAEAGTSKGHVTFSDIEKGTYTLKETKAPDASDNRNGYVLDTTVYSVVVDENGGYKITYETTGEDGSKQIVEAGKTAGTYQLTDEPLHYITFTKKSSYDKSVLAGAEFRLRGVSDKGNSVDMTAVSGEGTGTVRFDNLESGTYVLVETKVPTNGDQEFNMDTVKHIVVVNEDGTYTISGLTKDNGGYVLYNTPVQNKKITVKKIWQDGITNHKPDDLAITIQTKVPEASNRTFTIVFDANGGSFGTGGENDGKNTVKYNARNQHTEGTYAEPGRSDGYTFLGWATDKTDTKADTSVKLTPEDTTNTYLMGKADGSTTTLYAVWAKYAYAVQIYGIGVDELQSGTAGLTFGPAIGGNYVNNHKSHTPSGTTTSGNAHRCIHDDSWENIVSWNKTDPNVYEQCIDNQCTQSVPLTFTNENSGGSDKVFNKAKAKTVTGDGAGILYREIQDEARKYANSTGEFITLNWANSKIRAALNGAQSDTNSANGGLEYSADNSVLSAFPTVLQENIGAKAVKYANSYNDYNKDIDASKVYDKLWLFSNVEIYGDSIEKNQYYSSWDKGYWNYKNEGNQYQRTIGITTGKYKDTIAFYADGGSGSSYWWWLRSRYGYVYDRASYVNDDGRLGNSSVYRYSIGVAPGFVLAR